MKIQTTLVLLSALALAASAQTQQVTPAPTSVSPAATPAASTPAATPAATTPAATPAATTPAATPAATVTSPAATPAATTTTRYDPANGCWSVSVERDATYCITGPICSGSGAQPAGWNCPKQGDVATERCLPYLKSYTSGSCVAPVDAECKVIRTGAWGCVLKGDNATAVTPAPTRTGNSTNSSSSSRSDNGTIQAPTRVTNLAGGVDTGSSAGAATIGAVAAVAAIACAAIGTVLYKKNQSKSTVADEEQEVVDVVTP